jgi:TolB-like protein/DNA-binding SARP family transcriptional activator/Tfp pilus assembly protein PilF
MSLHSYAEVYFGNTVIQLTTLGRFSVSVNGEVAVAVVRQPLLSSVLCYIAVERHASRDAVLALFWGDREPERARHALSQTLYSIRQTLGEPFIEAETRVLRAYDTLQVDSKAFLDLVAAGKLADALRLYQGPFLAGGQLAESPGFDSWVERRRSHIARAHRQARRAEIETSLAAGGIRPALELARVWTEIEPLEDEAHHKLIELLAMNGDRADAIRYYERYERLIHEELDVDPLDETKELVEQIRTRKFVATGWSSVRSSGAELADRASVERAAERDVASDNGVATVGAPSESPIGPEWPDDEDTVDNLPRRVYSQRSAAATQHHNPIVSFALELVTRRVVRVAAIYLIITFVILQLADQITGIFGLPPWSLRLTVLLSAAGFVCALGLGWIYDITKTGGLEKHPWRPRFLAGSNGLTNAPSQADRSIAILPFMNLSRNADDDYFSDGITDEIIARASVIPDLKVISRTSIMQYKGTSKSMQQIGEELAVAFVVEGSVRRIADRLRIVARMIEPRTELHRWSDAYNKRLEDVITVQIEVAQRIAEALHADLTPQDSGRLIKRPTLDLDAYDLFLRGRHAWNRRTVESLQQSLVYYQAAIDLDADFAMAQAAMADSYITLGIYGAAAPRQLLEAARQAAETALAIQSDGAEALSARGSIKAFMDWDWRGSEADFKSAITRNARYATAHQWYAMHCLTPLGRFDEAASALARARELDPLSPAIESSVGVLYYYRGAYKTGIAEFRRVLEQNPRFSFAHYFLGLCFVELGSFERAIAELEQAVSLSGKSAEIRAALARACILAGNVVRGKALLEQVNHQAESAYVSAANRAAVYVALGDTERAFELLLRALDDRALDLIWLNVSPAFTPLRGEARFAQLVSRMGLA